MSKDKDTVSTKEGQGKPVSARVVETDTSKSISTGQTSGGGTMC